MLGKTVSKTVIAAVVEVEVRPVYDVRPAEMTVASVVLSKVALRRMTKRLAAAAHLQRDERWKRRLHPAAW